MNLMTQAVENIYRYGKSILTIDSKKQSIVFFAIARPYPLFLP